jgi:hypothetical protein
MIFVDSDDYYVNIANFKCREKEKDNAEDLAISSSKIQNDLERQISSLRSQLVGWMIIPVSKSVVGN